jgi:CubicO group peptidase (beta-lactamase class C family)
MAAVIYGTQQIHSEEFIVHQPKRLALAIALSLLGVTCGIAFAQAQKPGQPPPTKDAPKAPSPATAGASGAVAAAVSTQGHELTATDLEAFFDGFLPQQIEKKDIAGAVIAVVKDGKPIFEKGYGYSDVANKKPISPQDTLFRPGSISKTFTWTAVMQQVEMGKLDLDKDVNTYLDYKLPANFGKPTTLRDIMTHRPGLEETIKDLFVGSIKDLTPINQYLPTHIPHQIFPPGTIPAYSNYATTAAAYAVQRVSGENFDDYLDNHLLKPLGMTRATFRQPLPDSLKQYMSNGYALGSDKAKDFEAVEVAPAGSLSASADSMTHWMIMHLQKGKYGDVQIFKPETAAQMYTRQKGWPDQVNGMCLGFYEQTTNGHRSIGHGGDTQWFHSNMHLLINDGVGLFISYNSAGIPGRGDPRGMLWEAFMDRYFPAAPSNEPTLVSASADAKSVAGPYNVSRRFETNILAITSLLGQAKIEVDPKDNTIFVAELKSENGQPRHYREVAPMVFQNVAGKDKIVFAENNGQRVAYIEYPFMLFQPVDGALDNQALNYVLICFGLAVIALTILLWPVAWALRKHYGKPLVLDSGALKWRRYLRIVCLIDVLFVVFLMVLLQGLQKPGGLGAGGDLKIHLMQIIGLLGGLGAIVAIIAALKSWGDQTQWFWYKLWNTLVAIGCVFFFWFIWHWHLLNFDLHY